MTDKQRVSIEVAVDDLLDKTRWFQRAEIALKNADARLRQALGEPTQQPTKGGKHDE